MPGSQTTPQSPQTLIKTLSIIHLALLAGQVIFCVLVYIQTEHSHFDIKNTGDPFLFVVPIMAFGGFVVGNLLFKQALNKLAGKESLKEKIMGYQTACIIRFSLLEGASLFGIVVYLLTGNLFFLSISGLIILYFFMLRPTKEKIADDLALSYEDKMELDSPEPMQ